MLVTLKVKGSGDAYKREGGYRSVCNDSCIQWNMYLVALCEVVTEYYQSVVRVRNFSLWITVIFNSIKWSPLLRGWSHPLLSPNSLLRNLWIKW